MPLRQSSVAVIGATGVVGREMLAILDERGVPAARVRAVASARSSGSRIPYGEETLTVLELGAPALEGIDVALFAADAETARAWAPGLVARGVRVVDNSSAFRMDPDVPLVVPEVNAAAASPDSGLVANPNCSTIILVMALTPLHRAFGCERIVVSTYQAVSGAGAAAMEELRDQTRRVLEGGEPMPAFFREPCAFNLFSHDSAVDPATGRNGEEDKMIRETRRIWGHPGLRLTATCVRVPVLRAHTESINVTLRKPAAEDEIRAALAGASGVTIVDDRAGNRFPTPLAASGRDDVLVGRIRLDGSQPVDGSGRGRGVDLLACGDQLRKGAALNAIQIAEMLAGARDDAPAPRDARPSPAR